MAERAWRIVFLKNTTHGLDTLVNEALGDRAEIRTKEELMGIADEVRAVVTLDSIGLPSGFVSAATGLEWVHVQTHGYERILTPEFMESDVTLTNTQLLAEPVAEMAFTMLLNLTRRGRDFILNQKKHVWERLMGTGLTNKTMLIAGFGPIGREIARRARGFNMHVIAVSRSRPSSDLIHEGFTLSEIDSVIPRADVIVLALPGNKDTLGLFDARRLDLVKGGAFMINIARGGLVDEVKLREMLIDGRLSGAGFDVFGREPLPEDDPLWDTPNMLVFAHSSGFTSDSRPWLVEFSVQQVQRFLAGEPLENIVRPGSAR